MMMAMDFEFGPNHEIVLAGKRDDPALLQMKQAVF
jgi:hypothetical protein